MNSTNAISGLRPFARNSRFLRYGEPAWLKRTSKDTNWRTKNRVSAWSPRNEKNFFLPVTYRLEHNTYPWKKWHSLLTKTNEYLNHFCKLQEKDEAKWIDHSLRGIRKDLIDKENLITKEIKELGITKFWELAANMRLRGMESKILMDIFFPKDKYHGDLIGGLAKLTQNNAEHTKLFLEQLKTTIDQYNSETTTFQFNNSSLTLEKLGQGTESKTYKISFDLENSLYQYIVRAPINANQKWWQGIGIQMGLLPYSFKDFANPFYITNDGLTLSKLINDDGSSELASPNNFFDIINSEKQIERHGFCRLMGISQDTHHAERMSKDNWVSANNNYQIMRDPGGLYYSFSTFLPLPNIEVLVNLFLQNPDPRMQAITRYLISKMQKKDIFQGLNLSLESEFARKAIFNSIPEESWIPPGATFDMHISFWDILNKLDENSQVQFLLKALNHSEFRIYCITSLNELSNRIKTKLLESFQEIAKHPSLEIMTKEFIERYVKQFTADLER